MAEISDRQQRTQERINDLQGALTHASGIISGKACVYATGSFGRLEAGERSDLDLFILNGQNLDEKCNSTKTQLSNLDTICLKAELVNGVRQKGIPDFNGDGRYLVEYSVHGLISTLGTPEDDSSNTFTARLLMLLESRALIGQDIYENAIADVVAAYWRDYSDHKNDFRPAFLANDILRLWRTFCVNYEARTERTTQQDKRKGKIKNYKLKHSRLLTCYSALLSLLNSFNKKKTVTPHDVIDMTRLSPMQRIINLAEDTNIVSSHEHLHTLKRLYEEFLISTKDEKILGDRLMDPETGKKYSQSTFEFGDTMCKALNAIGAESSFHRMLIV